MSASTSVPFRPSSNSFRPQMSEGGGGGNGNVPSSWWKQSACINALIVIGIVIAIALLSKWSESDKQYSKPMIKALKSLTSQATRWNAMAQQDTNPLLQLTHCNYALCYAQIARMLAPEKDIEHITGIDIHEMIFYLEECQSFALKNIGAQCPTIKIEGVYSIGSGWTN